MKNRLKKKRATLLKTQPGHPLPLNQRLSVCAKWLAATQGDWEVGPRRAFRAGEKVFRIGAMGGGGDSDRAWVDDDLVKAGLSPDAAQRGDGAQMGGRRVLVCFGPGWYGKGTAHCAGQKDTLRAESRL